MDLTLAWWPRCNRVCLRLYSDSSLGRGVSVGACRLVTRDRDIGSYLSPEELERYSPQLFDSTPPPTELFAISATLRAAIKNSTADLPDAPNPKDLPADWPPLPDEAKEPGCNYYFLGWPIHPQFWEAFIKFRKIPNRFGNTRIAAIFGIISRIGLGFNLRIVRVKPIPEIPSKYILEATPDRPACIEFVALCSTGSRAWMKCHPTREQMYWLITAFSNIEPSWYEDAFPKHEFSLRCGL
ncbi:hypothetical protein HGRIS_010135 [Hohenbuehelia grisea]|uniref:Uncharacterized protein n=1 Tax=Hohenbuehelia grisea TaxID=104357 RepID=A0ABR3J3E0_9AGAR